MRKQLLAPVIIFLTLIIITFLVVLYGKGYRIGQFQNGKPIISKTGILVTTSNPNGAQVFIDGNLTSATNDTIDLLPGEYMVKISKEGYFPWEKKLTIQKEVVTKADAQLFPTAPRLENITSSGVEHPVIDPSGRKLAFRIASQSAKKNGIYVLDMTNYPVLSLQSTAKQITDDVTAPFSQSDYQWGPDGEELVASIPAELDLTNYFLLQSNGFNDTPRNVTAILSTVTDRWEKDLADKNTARFNALRKPVRTLIQNNFHILAWSPDETKILYTASVSAQLPLIIKPRRIGIDTMREERKVEKDNVYVYDIQDDINMKVMSADSYKCKGGCTPPLQWFPDSGHLILVQNSKISIIEDDGTNATTIYAGPFLDHYVFPWPDGSKLVILTNFNNPGVQPNLYTISLK